MNQVQFKRPNMFIETENDELVIERDLGGIHLCIDEKIHGFTDNGMTTSWFLSNEDVDKLLDFLKQYKKEIKE